MSTTLPVEPPVTHGATPTVTHGVTPPVTLAVDLPEALSFDAPPAIEPYLHEASDTVRFQVPVHAILVDASINRPALRHCFGMRNTEIELLDIYTAHARQIHAAVRARLDQGARAPVMLREAHFPVG